METNDLKGQSFEKDGKRYVICAGKEGGEIAFAEAGNTEAVLRFCCDAELSGDCLFGTYFVTYMVTKNTFFNKIDALSKDRKTDADTIASALKSDYFRIPRVFLRLVGEMYLQENADSE